ncbi:MAG TPA: glycogen debranching protein GlgX [Gammaproteobacteria bacterium]|nr:glycogen debranching protein GlgX [Gammaproteobacteria bacterium]
MPRHEVLPGKRLPGGATPGPNGINFSLFSRCATGVQLLLYDDARAADPFQVIDLDPAVNRTFFFWHVFVVGAKPGLFYTWRVHGPNRPEEGFRYDARHELLDPWAREVSDAVWNRSANRESGRTSMRARVPAPDGYDWEGDRPLRRPLEDTIVYELHVRGFTRHASSGVEHPGTFRGLIEKIPYLKSLGVTDVELMPIFAFDTQDVPAGAAALGLSNYWGYSPYGFFAPHPHYAASEDPRTEFRDLVKALHRAGIGVILDVVLNHTAEGGDDGPVISFKGLGNEFFYHLDPRDKRKYRDFTGCGNTINCNHPLVARFLLQCLEFWVTEMHVDGFRVDLASVLSRGEDGEPMYHAPVLWSIEFSDVLGPARLIAEAWDAAGLYQVGDFPGFRWLEWNGKYRDTLRRYLRGDAGLIGDVATRLMGSSDFYAATGRNPTNSVNFVTCHDGFTLYDLVSYDRKRNEANGEDGRDGAEENWSWNSGAEGPTSDLGVERLREQRARNFMALLLLSQGVPMLLAGDERLCTQHGNNNAYCQDNEISWLDWSGERGGVEMLRFTRELIALRKRHPSLRRPRFVDPAARGLGSVRWYGRDSSPPDWSDPAARILCVTLFGRTAEEPALHVMTNMSREHATLPLPAPGAGRVWHRVVDTSLAPPEDVVPSGVPLRGSAGYALAPLAVAVFEER